MSPPEVTAEDLAYRRAAEAYFTEKGALARDNFAADQLQAFLSFEEHWRDFFAPEDEAARREYLTTPFQVRKAKFERFRRQCRGWEVSFRHCTRAAAEESSGSNWQHLRQQVEEQRTKTAEVREFYDNLDSMLDQERRKRAHPIEMLPHLRALGMPSDACLDDIKKQFKKLAKQHHPDRAQGDSVKMSELTHAYRALLVFHNRLAIAVVMGWRAR